jgi:hypothetical protein
MEEIFYYGFLMAGIDPGYSFEAFGITSVRVFSQYVVYMVFCFIVEHFLILG